MFSNLFFLFILLLLIGGTPATVSVEPFRSNLTLTILISITAYAATLLLIAIQNLWLLRRYNREKILTLTNIELLFCFVTIYYIMGPQRLFYTPFFFPFASSALTLFTLTLFAAGLFLHHYTTHLNIWGHKDASHRAWKAVSFLLPFALPFLILITLGDASTLFPTDTVIKSLPFEITPWMNTATVLTAGIAALIATMIFLPPILVSSWKCRPIENPDLLERFHRLCQRANFTHGGFLKWTAMEGSYNAAIVGIIGKFRYVMFTPKLLNRLKPEALESILAHEIGHNRYHHLLLYPLILFGMVVTGSIVSSATYDLLKQIFPRLFLWDTLLPILALIPFIATAALYFRFVFGYFSRQFERQADLYLYEVGVPPEAMIEALDEIAHASGGIHAAPNWHHGSIQDRIQFLRATKEHPYLIAAHHKRVRLSLIAYATLLTFALLV